MSVHSTDDNNSYLSFNLPNDQQEVKETTHVYDPSNDLANFYLKSGIESKSHSLCLSAAKLMKSIDVLETTISFIDQNDQRLKFTILKEGTEEGWTCTLKNDWTEWKFWDELSICAYWQKDYCTANKAYKQLMLNNKYPSQHKERIEFNGRFFEIDTSSYDILKTQIQHIASSINVSCYNKVPKVLHLIYLKGYDFGLHHYLCVKTASKNMDFDKIIIYNDEKSDTLWWIEALNIPNVQVCTIQPPKFCNFHAVTSKQHQSDIIRLLALYFIGGVYFDLDMLTYKPFDKLLQGLNSPIMMCRENSSRISNAMIACEPRSDFIKEWINRYETKYGLHEDSWGGLSVMTPHELALNYECTILDTETFLPFDYMRTDYFTQPSTSIDFSITFGVHLWDTEQQKRNILPKTLEDFKKSNSQFYKMFGSYLTDFSEKALDNKKMIISIEGNIGSGKSTLLDQLKDVKFNKSHIVILEDVKEWTSFSDSKDTNILEKYYEDQNKYGYCFQSLVLISRIQHLVDAINNNPNTIIFTERCPFTDLNIFAKTLYDKGALEEIEWLTYNQCHQILNRLCDIKIDTYIYNNCSSETCMKRIEKRNRKGEQNIPLELIEDLGKRHNDWLLTEKQVFVFDGEVELQNREQELQKLIQYINSL